MAEAYCWRTGVIGVGRKAPRGTLRLAIGGQKRLESALSPIARLAYDGTTLLVPGVPEAATDTAALDAVLAFVPRLRRGLRHNRKPGRLL